MAMTVKPIRPHPPAAATNVINLEVACIATLQERVRCATYTGKLLFTSDHRGVLYLWNVGDATNVKFHNGLGIPINVLQGANDGNDVWLGFSDGDIAILDIKKKNVGTRWKAHPGGVSCIVAMINSVWSGGVDFQIRKWGLLGEVLMAYGHHHTSIRWLCMVRKELHDTEMQMWSSSNEPEVSRCLVLDNKLRHDTLGDVQKGAGHTLAILVLCQVGKSTIWSGSEDNLIKVWSVLDLSLKQTMHGHKGPVCSMVEMALHVWSGSADGSILVWNATTFLLLFSLGQQGGYVKSMIKADWQLWTFASGKNIKIWTAASLWEDSKLEKQKLKEKINKFSEDKEFYDDGNRKIKDKMILELRKELKDVQEQVKYTQQSRLSTQKSVEISMNTMKAMINEINQLKELISKQKNETAHLSENTKNKMTHYDGFKKLMVTANFVLKHESQKMSQQMQASGTELVKMDEMLLRGFQKASISYDNEIIQLRNAITHERKSAAKNLDDKDVVNQELIQLFEQMNKERAYAEGIAEMENLGTKSQMTKLLKQLNIEQISAEDALHKHQNLKKILEVA